MSQNPEVDPGPVPGLATLATERAPARDLWPEIAARLGQAASQPAEPAAASPRVAAAPPARLAHTVRSRISARRRNWPAALAASVCVVALTGLMLPRMAAPLRPGLLHARLQAAASALASERFQRLDQMAAAPAYVADAAPAGGVEATAQLAMPEPQRASLPGSGLRFPSLRSEADDWPMRETGFVRVAYRPASERPAQLSSSLAASAVEVPVELQGLVRPAQAQRALLRANLRLMRQAEREVVRALKADPDSDSLQDLLTQVRNQRVQVQRLQLASRD